MKKALLLCLVISLSLIGCNKSDQGISDAVVSDGMVINNDLNSLNKRISFIDNSALYTFTDKQMAMSKGEESASISIQVIADLLPPKYNDETLQASHIRIAGNYAYLAYNTQGPRYLGGADIININCAYNPQLISSVVFIDPETNKGKDISSIDVESKGCSGNNNFVWMAGAEEENPSLQSPAIVERYILNSANQFVHSDQPRQVYNLPGYVGTDVRFFNNKVYATSGTGGGLTILNNGMNLQSFIDLPNARSVDINSTYQVALGRNPGTLLSPDRFSEVIGGASDPEAKSMVRLYYNYALAALGEEGLKCYNLLSSNPTEVVSSLPAPAVPEGKNSWEYVTNGVSVCNGWVYIANGAAGLDVAKIDCNGQLKWMGNIDLGASVNFVEANCNYVFVATGLGGLKILKITAI